MRISFVPVTLLGLVFMAREGLSLGRMRELTAEERTTRTLEAQVAPSQVEASGVIR